MDTLPYDKVHHLAILDEKSLSLDSCYDRSIF